MCKDIERRKLEAANLDKVEAEAWKTIEGRIIGVGEKIELLKLIRDTITDRARMFGVDCVYDSVGLGVAVPEVDQPQAN